jgi:subtilisin family serine protease
MFKKNLLIIILLLFIVNMYSNERISGEFIIKLHSDLSSDFIKKYSQYDLKVERELSARFNIYLCTFNYKNIDEDFLLGIIREDKDVHLAQYNHKVELREQIPNDTRFNEQWALKNTGQGTGTEGADIKATYAWQYTEDIPERNNREIVIAVIDNGFALNHPDINWWHNVNEVAGNGIDDDGNGYIDDNRGWNVYNNNNNLPVATHGTHVSGIVGAIGNNELGVSGVSWDLKVMPIAGSSSSEATVVAAYNYALENRIIYNESNGQNGAYVVATNSSFGVDFGNPVNYPIWGEMYNLMGEAGILSAVATMNMNANVDQVGDIPTSFTSSYLITVTNTTNTDNKNNGAAYGLTTIDLGAPGTSVLSTVPLGLGYANNTGTSMATPHVSGVIGLMYKVSNEELLQLYDDNPEQLALLFREIILSGVDPIPSLDGITVTGGRLNAYRPVLDVLALNHPDENHKSLFFSEYIDGSEHNKALEIFNPYSYDIDLSGFCVRLGEGENVWGDSLNLNGVLESNQTLVIYHPEASIEIQTLGDVASEVCFFNGDDSIGLFYENQLIDTIGNNLDISENGWGVAGILNATVNHTLVRKNSIFKGNTNWEEQSGNYLEDSEWIIYDLDTFDYLGIHSYFENMVATPIISPGSGLYIDSISISIVCATENSSIYYTLDNTIPDETSNLYTSSFLVYENTILKAIAYSDSLEPSEIITSHYEFPVPIDNLAELRASVSGDETLYSLSEEVIVSYADSIQLYVQDTEAGIFIENTDGIVTNIYNIGDGITGLIGNIENYEGLIKFIPYVDFGEPSSTGNEIIPIQTSLEEMNSFPQLYQAMLVKVDSLEFLQEGNFVDSLYYGLYDGSFEHNFKAISENSDYIGTAIPSSLVNITGIRSINSTDLYISSRKLSDFEIIPEDIILPPRNLKATVFDGNFLTLSWDEPDSLTTARVLIGYNVYKNNILLTETPILELNYTESDLLEGEYSYAVTAVYNQEESTSIMAEIFIGDYVIEDFPYNEGFESIYFPPKGWIIRDSDNDGVYWFGFSGDEVAYEGITCAVSVSRLDNGEILTPDNWLILPKLGVSESNNIQSFELNYWITSQPETAQEYYSVMVSTTDNQESSFEPFFSEIVNNNSWISRSIELSSEVKYIAFRHHNVTGQAYLKIDDIQVELHTSENDINVIPYITKLISNYPNPFNPITTISYTIGEPGNVLLEIYNIKGQKIKELVNENHKPGDYQVIWNAKDNSNNSVGNGIYLYRIKSGTYTSTKKMILLK